MKPARPANAAHEQGSRDRGQRRRDDCQRYGHSCQRGARRHLRGNDAAENHDDRQAGRAQHLGGGQHEYIA
jgi:hypothetical protein